MIGASARERQEAVCFVCFTDGFAGQTRGAPARQWPSAVKFEKGGSVGQIRGFDPLVSRKQLAGHDGLTRE